MSTTGGTGTAAFTGPCLGTQGARRPSALRAGLIASGVAFSASLILSSIERPVRDFDLPLPGLGRGDGDRIVEMFSDQLRGNFIGEARLAAVTSMLTAPGHPALDARQFLDYVAREIPEIYRSDGPHPPAGANTPMWVAPAPAAAEYQVPAFTGGGGGSPGTWSPPPGQALPTLVDVTVWVWDVITPDLGGSATQEPPAPPIVEVPQTPATPTETVTTSSPTSAEFEPPSTVPDDGGVSSKEVELPDPRSGDDSEEDAGGGIADDDGGADENTNVNNGGTNEDSGGSDNQSDGT
ncbi:hypothetical protein [Mycolicibacterium litorale]|uniref:Uncharacterized protein n=1 Tax=Mycolicibacterium litorale TaxID=758802 RepID=A0AAD1INW2_9MYCO|nr:hypothetical protein [Mycolicibacterium litorale]MCV7418109.1 hypothetical protein [Mycolicibacterium litorale]TDY06503.1 hypothetical protein BCL50_2828 [Mycolicibacterium litorale]BBY19352.1 hypothetical protein MLIT_49440 [Mycolicibacterium litorale]